MARESFLLIGRGSKPGKAAKKLTKKGKNRKSGSGDRESNFVWSESSV
jgi:hypothetical protein